MSVKTKKTYIINIHKYIHVNASMSNTTNTTPSPPPPPFLFCSFFVCIIIYDFEHVINSNCKKTTDGIITVCHYNCHELTVPACLFFHIYTCVCVISVSISDLLAQIAEIKLNTTTTANDEYYTTSKPSHVEKRRKVYAARK